MARHRWTQVKKSSAILLLIILLPLYAAAQASLQHYMPVKHTIENGEYGPQDSGSSETIGRQFEYTSPHSALVSSYVDMEHYNYSGGTWNYIDTPFAFSGDVQVYDDKTIVLLPASTNSPYLSRELSIRNDGYILADRYLHDGTAGMEFHYYYNEDNVACATIMRQWTDSGAVSYHKTEFICDAQGRRLEENMFSSADSLNWQPEASRQYSYTGEAFSNTKDYEKYGYYRPRDHELSLNQSWDFPYVSNNWMLQAMTETDDGGELVVNSYDYSFYHYDVTYNGRGYSWDTAGLPQSITTDGAQGYHRVTYTWRQMSVSNQDPTQSPVPATVRAYPNPFNPSTTLEFELKQSCNPVIKVYNVRGQLGRVYAPGMLSSGTHKWHFDGKDMRGNELPGGIYLVKMELPGRAVVTRITLMK